MMPFMGNDFLLTNETARTLYHSCAEALPVVDFRCCIPPEEISDDPPYVNITEALLQGDFGKQRAMRTCGIDESLITGSSSDYEKFAAFAAIFPKLIGNPVYYLTQLQLQRFFDCSLPLSAYTADEIWHTAAEKLSDASMSARQILQICNAESICTVSDAADFLSCYRKTHDEPYEVLLPAFSPDRVMDIRQKDYKSYLRSLETAAEMQIRNLSDLKEALSRRMDSFHLFGCRTAVCKLPSDYHFNCAATNEDIDVLFQRVITSRHSVTPEESDKFRTHMLCYFGNSCKQRDWVLQLYSGSRKDINKNAFRIFGGNRGYDCLGDSSTCDSQAQLLNSMTLSDALPKTLLCSSDPADHAKLATLAAIFQQHDEWSLPTVALGSAYGFSNDLGSIRAQMDCYASLSCFGTLPGTATGAGNPCGLIFHEYYRRILCNKIGEMAERGEYPLDWDALYELVTNICYMNAKTFFKV